MLTHGDLHLRHILLHGGRPALIDLDAFAEADPLLDIALVLSDLAAMPLDSPLPPRARAEGLTSLRRGILRTCSAVLARRVPHPLRSAASVPKQSRRLKR